jgi:hypothetical protein
VLFSVNEPEISALPHIWLIAGRVSRRRMGQGADFPSQSGLPVDEKPKRLIERLREEIRTRHYSQRTEQAYWYWIRWFIRFHGKRHPLELGGAEVTAFLSMLATERNVAAATQNQALSALLFLYKHVLGRELPWLTQMVRAQRAVRLPTVLSEAEVRRVLANVDGIGALMVGLLYGAGRRQIECLQLRVKDVDFAYRQILVRDGKGRKEPGNDAAGKPGAAAPGAPWEGEACAPARSRRGVRRGGIALRAGAQVSARGMSAHP